MTSPWPGIIPGYDVSLERVADLKTAKGGDELARELERPRHRRPGLLRGYRRRGNPPDPRNPSILWPREVERIKAGIYSD